MAVTILGGMAKGFRVTVPRGGRVRPMAASLKRRPFDACQDLSPYHFVDLCAGSGAVGLEAWSRGAQSVTFYEKSLPVYSILRDNIGRFKTCYSCSDRPIELICGDCLKWRGESYDSYLLFFAPPYGEHQLYHHFLTRVKESDFRGGLWLESNRQKGLCLSDIQSYFNPERVYDQGSAFVCVFDFSDR